MDRIEFIKKISEAAGVAESDSGRFFENFAVKSSDTLENNQVLELHDLGYIKVEGKEEKRIVFSEMGDFNAEDVLDFYISRESYKTSAIDDAFSLSLDKLNIPLSDELSDDFSYHPAGVALEDLIESKADDFIAKSNVVTEESLLETRETLPAEEEHYEASNETEEEVGIAEEEPAEDESDIKSKFQKVEPESSKPAETEEVKEEETPKVEEESEHHDVEEFEIVDINDLVSSEKDDEEVFGVVHGDEEVAEEETKEEDIQESEIFEKVKGTGEDLRVNELNAINEEETSEVEEEEEEPKESEPEVESKKEAPETEEKKDEDKEHGFQIVNPVLPGLPSGKFVPKEPSKLFEVYKTADEVLNFDDKGFVEVKPPKSVDSTKTPPLEPPTHEDEIDQSKIDKYNQIKSGIPAAEKSSGGKWKFILPIILLIVIGGIVLIYINNMRQPKQNEQTVQNAPSQFVPSHPTIIYRNFDIPVNYPYKINEGSINFEPLDLGILSNKGKVVAAKPVKVHSDSAKETAAVTKTNTKTESSTVNRTIQDWERAKPIPAGNFKQVDNYIYTNGKTYFIQVASWKVLARALEHNSKLRKKGYNSSIQKLVAPSGYVYYIVKIGNFNSLKEAHEYLRSH